MNIIISNIVMVMLSIKLWTANKKLSPEDLAINGIDISKLPPHTLAHLGSKKIISPAALAPFSALKKEAERVLLAEGVRLLGGFAIPSEKIKEVVDQLDNIKTRFNNEKTKLLAKYHDEVELWIGQNPAEWEPIIRSSVEPLSHVDRAIQFSFAPFAIANPEGLEDCNTGLEEETAGLFGQLCKEVRITARRAYDVSFVGRMEVTRKALRPIAAIRQKLAGMIFLDPSIADTIATIDETLEKLPKSGAITGSDLNMVGGLLGRQLSNIGRPIPAEPVELVEEPEVEEIKIIIPTPFQSTAELAPLAWDF